MGSRAVAGRVAEVLPVEEGPGRRRSRAFIIETADDGQVRVTQWGEDIERRAVEVGDAVTAHVDIRSGAYVGRWDRALTHPTANTETEGD